MSWKTKKQLALFALGIMGTTLPVAGYGATFSIAAAGNGAKAASSNKTRSFDSDELLGYGAGALLEFGGGMLGTETGLIYVQRAIGYSSAIKETSTWVEVPVLLRLHAGGFSLGAGGYLARGVGSIKADIASTTTSLSYSDAQLSNLDYGFSGALGYTFPFKAFVDIRYNAGLKNLSKVDDVTYKFSEFQLFLGYRF